MPSRPTVVFLVTSAFAFGACAYAHWAQVNDMKEMHKGVVRDKERQRVKNAK